MEKGDTLISTTIELKREFDDHHQSYFKLIIGTDPDSRVILTDSSLESLLDDLPNVLSTVINSQVLIEAFSTKEEIVS